MHAFSRTELLLGRESIQTLKQSRVAVFGIGGVGTFAVEGLARSGVGRFVLVDDDLICLTNINRQLHATRKTIGQPKVAAMKARILEINPQAEVTVFQRFYLAPELPKRRRQAEAELDQPAAGQPDAGAVCGPAASAGAPSAVPPIENGLTWAELLAFHVSRDGRIDYIIDAIDTVSAKLDLIVNAQQAGIPVISCMGAGNKLDPTRLEVADIYETTVCPLARVMRRELRRLGVPALKVVYSREEPLTPVMDEANSCSHSCVCPKGAARTCTSRRSVPGSVAFVPSVAGLIMAGEVVRGLTRHQPTHV